MEATGTTYVDSMDAEPLESARGRMGGEVLWPATEVLGGGVSTMPPENSVGVPNVCTCTSQVLKYKY
jgi:hypothetical protein